MEATKGAGHGEMREAQRRERSAETRMKRRDANGTAQQIAPEKETQRVLVDRDDSLERAAKLNALL